MCSSGGKFMILPVFRIYGTLLKIVTYKCSFDLAARLSKCAPPFSKF